MIAIIDYGMGNIHSVQKALEYMKIETLVTNRAKEISSCEKVVLPGVGAFDDAVLELKKQGLVEPLKGHINQKKPFLGICLGMHILFEKSQEAKKTKGLGVLKGTVRKFKGIKGIKVPHIGWNQIKVKNSECPLLKNTPEDAHVYFCHSYYPKPKSGKVVAATTDYGIDFASVVWQDNVFGIQFHPEKSQKVGLQILRNFVNL